MAAVLGLARVRVPPSSCVAARHPHRAVVGVVNGATYGRRLLLHPSLCGVAGAVPVLWSMRAHLDYTHACPPRFRPDS